MKRKWTQRCYAWVLAGALAVSGLPSVSLAAGTEGQELSKLADFSFDADAENNLFSGGDNAQAAVNGNCQTKIKYGADKALYLDGKDAFVNITAKDGSGILAGKEKITISYDAKPEKGAKSWTVFAAPNGNTQAYESEHYLGVLHTTGGIQVERYNNSGKRPGNNINTTASGAWTHVDLTITETETKVYVNGEAKGNHTSTYKLSDILGASGGVLQAGKGNWESGEYFQGYIDNFRIYDGILSGDAIAAQYQEFQNTLEEIKKYEEDQKQQEEELKKQQALQKDYDALEILNQDDVRGNLPLIRQGKNGSSITWTSSNPDVITQEAQGGLYQGGIVHRPAAGSQAAEVTLTAVLKSAYNEETKTKTFNVKVQPEPADLDTDYSAGYLWTNFGTEGGYEKIFLGYSEDGLTWNKLNKLDGVSQPILANDAEGSDLGVRDPHIIRSAEGDRYWILGTDLHAEGGGAGGSGWNQLGSSQNLVVWESADLVNWSEPRLVYAGFDNAGCVWAPEAIYDDATEDYAVYWSARDKSKAGTDDNALRVYVCRTRDFHTFSEPKVWLSEDATTGNEVNIIDSTIVKDNGKFYRFSTSDWNTIIDVSDTLDTEDVLDVRVSEEQSQPNGSWKRLVKRSGNKDAGFDGREGLTVYKLPDGRWCVMGDNQGYKAFVTSDLSTGKFTAANASFPDGKFRHGTVMRLSAAEQERVLEAFKDRESEPVDPGDPIEEPVLHYDFEADEGKTTITDVATAYETKSDGQMKGNATVAYDEERKSKVLVLDGSNGSYAEIPQGFFDNRDVMSISMDVKSEKDSGNFFTFAYGKSDQKYNYLRVRGTDVSGCLTVNSWENEKKVTASGAATGKWQNIILVIDGRNMKLYLDGKLVSENENTGILTSSLGTDLLSYLGKSFYSGDGYFKGSFDNFKVYNRALTKEEIAAEAIKQGVPVFRGLTVGTIPENHLDLRGTDDHTAVLSNFDKEAKVITSYVRKGTDLKAVPVTLDLLLDSAQVTVDGKAFTGAMDLTKDAQLKVSVDGTEETYTVKKPEIAGNPVLPGQYADPDIDYFDGKFWIYPTTDGYPGWSGTVFHAFSSPDMVNWEDEGIILELANANPGLNDKGVQIAASPWAVGGSAWAPTIEKKNGKYYFYYCGKDSSGTSAVGVAVADHPAGPYTDKGTAVLTKAMTDAAGAGVGQAIDPSIFTDDDGTSYMLVGNGSAVIAELNEDMMSIKEGTIKRINGITDFRESVIVTKVDGKYHWTWSCDDANSPNYHVNYGISDKLIGDDGKVNVTLKKKNLLAKDESKGILGSAHQSVVHIKDTDNQDRYFMAYHRFYTPLGIFTSADGLGKHRETCVDEITFDANGEMVITPTQEGTGTVDAAGDNFSVTLKPGLTEQEDGSIAVNVEEITPGKKNVTVILPDALAESITGAEGEKVSVNVNIPEAMAGAVDTITLPKEVLEEVKKSGKDLVITLNGNASYQWSFTGAVLAEADVSDVNLRLDIDSDKDQEIKDLLAEGTEGIVVSVSQHTAVAGAKLVIDTSKMEWQEGEETILSYYNPKAGALERVDKYTIGKDGKIEIAAPCGGKYILWKGSGAAVEIYSVTLDPNGGTVDRVNIDVVKGDKIGTLPEAARQGYVFLGWYTQKEDGEKVTESTTVEEDRTIYAHWAQMSFGASGSQTEKDGTYLIAMTGDRSAEGADYAAAYIEGETATGGNPLGSTRVGCMAFEIPQEWKEIDQNRLKATLTINVARVNHELGSSKTKAGVFVVDQAFSEVDVTDESTYPAKDGNYSKTATVFSNEWIAENDLGKKTFDVTEMMKDILAKEDAAHAIFRLQTVTSGFYVSGTAGLAPSLTVTLAKAEPEYTVPTGLTAVYGDTLADVTLPSGFEFQDPLTTPVGNAGSNTFLVTYTPEDTENYEIVTGIEVAVQVAPKDMSGATVTGIEDQNYTGSAVTLPNLRVEGCQEGTDYTVSYQDNVNAGSAKVTITFTGNYTGTIEKTFQIKNSSSGNPGGGDNPGGSDNNNQNKPGNNQGNNDQNKPGNNTPNNNNVKPVPAKNKVFKVGKFNYKVTKSAKKGGTVELKAPTKKTMTSASVPSSVKINGYTFNVTSIGKNAFKNNKKLTKVTIGANVTKIGANAFSGCKKLKKLTVKSKKLKSVGKNALKGIHKNAVISVPKAKKKAYKKIFKSKGQKKTVKIK